MATITYNFIIVGVFVDYYTQLYMALWVWMVLHPIMCSGVFWGSFIPDYMYTLGLGGFTPDYILGGVFGDFYAQLYIALWVWVF